MKAAVLHDFDCPLEITEVEDPRLEGPQDVIVKIAGAGICGSDIHLIEGMFKDGLGTPRFPYVMGHENVGFVHAVGKGVTTIKVGDPVLAHPHITCGLCLACRRGNETFCETLVFPGIDGVRFGGFAEYFRTNERALVKLPSGSDPKSLVSLTDAGLTAYHAVRNALGALPPDGAAVIIGLGGVGFFALQILKLFSPVHTIAVDVAESKLLAAKQAGADVAIETGPDIVSRVIESNGGKGVDLVFDCVGIDPVPEQALAMLARGGHYSIIGADKGQVCCGTIAMTVQELSITGNLVGTIGELSQLAQLTVRRQLKLKQTYYPLDDVNIALDDLRNKKVEGRAILVP